MGMCWKLRSPRNRNESDFTSKSSHLLKCSSLLVDRALGFKHPYLGFSKNRTPHSEQWSVAAKRGLSKQFEKSLANWSESRWNWWPLHIWDLEQKCAPTKGKFIENMARRPLYFANQNTALLEGCSGICPLGSDCLHRWSLKEVTAFLAFLKLWMRTKKKHRTVLYHYFGRIVFFGPRFIKDGCQINFEKKCFFQSSKLMNGNGYEPKLGTTRISSY